MFFRCSKQAFPLKLKKIHTKQAPYMNKELRKTIYRKNVIQQMAISKFFSKLGKIQKTKKLYIELN